ncbi:MULTISPECIES: HAD family hydrolase [unclassified Streptomyces]|uniref:HAD family hydrolase n=1 Tax=unclassified Streptomyces TaxID=2593676 RepID=UPI002250634A|nr:MULTISPECIES: HAD family hydrolase [unclassified Streptomyces]MCX4885750.1 HAD family hydrolase [Streptomyces sp. NBC_00847]MCX5425624.1 HAD family hydrolase [Streptomyces sp. NBC_00078]
MERAAVFDVDGTLVDTNHLHVVTWWEAFRQAGHTVPMHAIHRAVGLGSDDLVAHLLGDDRDTDQDAELSAAHKALYGQYFARLPALQDAGRLLRRLDHDGWTVVLATSAGGPELSALRRAISADDAITATASADDVEEGKPAPEPVEHALKLAGVPADRAVFVGDTVWDMQAGSRAGVHCVGVLCGGIPRADLEEAGARTVYDGPAHLLANLADSPLRQR